MTTASIAAMISEEQLSRFTGYPVTLPVFEGPLDLLLYLIRRQQLDIYDIPISHITAQFCDYLALMEALDVEIAAEFPGDGGPRCLEIKSRMLLPRPPVIEEEEEQEEEDPRTELVRRLLEYQRFKSAAGELQKRGEEQTRVVSRPSVVAGLPLLRPDPQIAGNPDAFALWQALQDVLARMEEMTPTVREVARPNITIRRQIMLILKLLEENPDGLAFSRIFFHEAREHPLTRLEIIVTFLALLELIRMHRLIIIQPELFGEIKLRAVTPVMQ